MIRVTNIICACAREKYTVKPIKRKKTLRYFVTQFRKFHNKVCSVRMYFNPASPLSERFYLLK